MLKVQCPHCQAVNTELLWNETTAEKLRENLKRLVPLRDAAPTAKYFCPSCEQASLRNTLEVKSTDEEVARRVFTHAYALAAESIKSLHNHGVIADTKENILKMLPLINPIYCLTLFQFENAGIQKEHRNGARLKAVHGNLGQLTCFSIDVDGAVKEEDLGILTFLYNVKDNRLNNKWKSLNRDPWSDASAYITSHKLRMSRRKRLDRNYVPPKTRMGADGMFYVSYPTVDGKRMQTVRFDEFMGNPLSFKNDLSFEEFLQLLCDTEIVHQNPPADAVLMQEEPIAARPDEDVDDEDDETDYGLSWGDDGDE